MSPVIMSFRTFVSGSVTAIKSSDRVIHVFFCSGNKIHGTVMTDAVDVQIIDENVFLTVFCLLL